MRIRLVAIALLLCSSTKATTFSVGVFKPNDDVQDSNGKDETNPFSPTIALSTVFEIWHLKFFPQIGYIYHKVENDDRYGGDFKKETIYLLYDFIFTPEGGFQSSGDPEKHKIALRAGIGNFLTKIKGDGGSVTVPNGSSTTTAYKPEKSNTNYVGSLNLGLDFNGSLFNPGWDKYGARLQLFFFSPLKNEKRTSAMMITGHYVF